MNFQNLFTLTIRVVDFNLVPQHPELLKQLRKLTLDPYSGMSKEITHLMQIMETRPVEAQVILAYRYPGKLAGWGLLSKEHSAIPFFTSNQYFRPQDGVLLEMFVHPSFRREGIGTEIMKVARRKAGPYRLCVAPWDTRSRGFYQKFQNYGTKWL